MSVIHEDLFDELYKPVQNHIDTNAGWSGTLFETFGEELEYIMQLDYKEPKRVWTLIEGDGGMTIVAGYHRVNRMGYIITEKEWVTGEEEVPQDMDMD